MEATLFRIGLKRRLWIRVTDMDEFCLLCGCTMDSFGDHALVCPCKGDRTIRHNRLRDIVCREAVEGGMQPEKEKAGLLPMRPIEEDHLEVPPGGHTSRSHLEISPGDPIWRSHLEVPLGDPT